MVTAQQHTNDVETKWVELLPVEYTRPVILIAFHAAFVPKALGSQMLKLLQSHWPLGVEFIHLKRVRSPPPASAAGAGTLEVLVCPEDVDPPAAIVDFLSSKGYAPCHAVQVPHYAALTRSQLADYSQHWPLTYRKPSFEPLQMSSHMHDFYTKLLRQAERLGGCRCGCVIVDKDGQVLAEAVDESSAEARPLAHAVMVAIEKVAAQRANGQHATTIAPDDANAPQSQNSTQQEATLKRPRDEGSALGDQEYLCHDCEVVTTHEPCVMCAMALVHSRVRLVAYRVADPDFGGFGGQLSLHTCQSLNHQLRVLKC